MLRPVQVLPIVERELRAAARHSRTWWRRVLTLTLGLVIVALTWAAAGQFSTLSRVGHTVFVALTVFAFFYALLAGPLATTDCLSRERREGTLGLLFLTHLRGYDIVLGKIAASSLDVALGLLAAFPLLAMPVLAGGISLAQFGTVIIFLLNVMVLSLALGICSSSLLASGRASLAVTLGALLFLILGLPIIGEELLHLRTAGYAAGLFYMCCPYWGLVLCLDFPGLGASTSKYWLNIAGTQVVAWILVGIACLFTARGWRELPETKLAGWWRRRRERRLARSRTAGRRRLQLENNPIGWVEGRSRFQERTMAVLVGCAAMFCILKHTYAPLSFRREEFMVLWALFTQYLLCLWIAIQAPRRFADDRQSGALELLLCTPLSTSSIVRGTMAVLWRQAGWALLAMVVLNGYVFHAHCSAQSSGWWSSSSAREWILLYLCSAVVFPAQGYAMARVGLYQGLAKANSLRATFTLIWSLGLLPWALFIAFLVGFEIGRRYLPFLPRINDRLAFVSWAGAHLLVFAVFLIRASWELVKHFRELAAGTAIPWWKRAWESLVEDFD